MNYTFQNSDIFQVFVEPIGSYLGFKVADPTFGRRFIQKNTFEKLLAENGLLHREHYLKGKAEPTIYYQTLWDKEEFPEPKLDLIYCHGFAEYGGRFAKIAIKFLEVGYRIHVLDLPAHGRSDGIHGNMNSLDEPLMALSRVIDSVKVLYPDKRYFLMGGSLGALTAINYCIDNPGSVEGLVAVCPALAMNKLILPPIFAIYFAIFLSYFVPRLIASPRKPNMITANPEDDLEFINDPMTYSRGNRIRTGLAGYFATKQIATKYHLFKEPIFIQQGSNDRMVDTSVTSKFFDNISSTEKSIKFYKDLEHDLYIPNSPADVFLDAIEWLNQKL